VGESKIGGRLLTVAELAEVLAVPSSWIYARTATGDIPHVCVGRYKRFRLGEVMRWLEGSNGGA
jgi:excisionase family DNA binding protein